MWIVPTYKTYLHFEHANIYNTQGKTGSDIF